MLKINTFSEGLGSGPFFIVTHQMQPGYPLDSVRTIRMLISRTLRSHTIILT